MSIYSSLMVASTPIGQAIFNLITQSGQNAQMLTVSYIWIETVAYGLGAVLMLFFGVEKNLDKDQQTIKDNQKAKAEAEGKEWIDPEELMKRQEEEAEAQVEEARKAELKARCEKKGLDFETEEAKYQAKLKKKSK